ncbi:sugar ABC transporter ATP-binding protein [Demequina sp. NBRC 110052]|uniref:sugar ABC transporter ATP-binding protein n=1 Tax=Demequina sp. NBRC 110052 TaxID=1570341 RepID=UPI001F45D47A|nr:sugar ABC transporter ATP-binding protein [Demequina sp. NBRC 110052]
MSEPSAPAIRMTGITKSFNGVTVLHGVDFEVAPGEVHALAGGNGAGKSTLMKILQGVYSREGGAIELFGKPFDFEGIHQAKAAGIGMVFQEFSLVPSLTVAQNIYLDQEPLKWRLIDDAAMQTTAGEIFSRMDVNVDVTADVAGLPTAEWQLTEIAKALSQDARVLIMDEPTASLSKNEVGALFELIGRLKAQGIAIVYISHRMDEVFQIADRITILRNGSNLLTSTLADISPEEIVNGIAGKELAAPPGDRRTVPEDAPVLLEVQGLEAPGIDQVSFQIRAGEIVGLAGLMGSGRTELARALFGVTKVTAGVVRKGGEVIDLGSPAKAIDQGIALVPEDRRLQGLVLDHSVRENLTLPLLDEVRSNGLLSRAKVKTLSDRLIEAFSIAVARPDSPARLLSGGNQQKIVLAKWLGTEPDVLILDEPTAGVDIGTKAEIVGIVKRLADEGKAVLVISSEYPELIAMCDRYLVVREGRIVNSIGAEMINSEVDLELAVQGIGS